MIRLLRGQSANPSKFVIILHFCCLLFMAYSVTLARTDVTDPSPLYNVTVVFWFLLVVDVAAITFLVLVCRSKRESSLAILLIMTLAFFVRVLPNIKYTVAWPFYSDISVHNAVITESISMGHIVQYAGAEQYSQWPLLDLIIMNLSLLSGLSSLAIMKFIAAVLSVFQVLFLYLIVRDAFKIELVALISALCLTISEVNVGSAATIVVHTTIAHTLFLLCIYLAVRYVRSPQHRCLVAFNVGVAALTFSHPAIGLWFWQILLFAVLLTYAFFKKSIEKRALSLKKSVTPRTISHAMILTLISLAFVLLWDFYAAISVSLPLIQGIVRAILQKENTPLTMTSLTSRGSQELLQLFPQSLILLLPAIIGGAYFLVMFRRAARKVSNENYALILIAAAVVYLLSGFVIQYYFLGSSLFNPLRYVLYVFDFFYVFVALGIWRIINRFGATSRRITIISVIVLFSIVGVLGVTIMYPSFERGQTNPIVDTYEICSAKWGLARMPAGSLVLSDTQIASAYVGYGIRTGYDLAGNPLYLGKRLVAFVEIVTQQNFSAIGTIPGFYSYSSIYVQVSGRMATWFVGVHAGFPHVEITTQNITDLVGNKRVDSVYSNGEVVVLSVIGVRARNATG